MLGVAWGIAIAVGVVGGSAASGKFFAARGLRELPDGGIGDAAGGWRRRVVRNDAAWRWRAGVVVDEVCEFALAKIVADVLGGDDGHAVALVHGHARAIHSGPIA